MAKSIDLLIVGCDEIGTRLAVRYAGQRSGACVQVIESDPERANALRGVSGVDTASTLNVITDIAPRAVIMSERLEPKSEAFNRLREHGLASGLVISLVEGMTMGVMLRAMPQARIVRAVPRGTAAARGGMTALFAARDVTDEDKLVCTEIFGCIGDTYWLDSESLMNGLRGMTDILYASRCFTF